MGSLRQLQPIPFNTQRVFFETMRLIDRARAAWISGMTGDIDTFGKFIKAMGFILVGTVAIPTLICLWGLYMFLWLVGYWSNLLMLKLKMVG